MNIRYLYRLVDKLNGKEYIGSTDSISHRFMSYSKISNRRQSILFQRIREIGFSNFAMIELCQGSEQYIRDLEEKAIVSFNTLQPAGYNMVSSTYGGAATGRKVKYNGRKIIYDGKIYDDPRDLIDLTGLSIASIRMHCNRLSRGFSWL